MTEVLIDYREKPLILELEKRAVPISIKPLALADIILQGQDYYTTPVSIAIERKTQTDFLNSIIDKRITTQLIAIKQNFPIYLLIIEGQENLYSLRDFHPNSIRGMLSSIALDLQIPIIQTKSIADTAAFIEVIHKRLEKPKKPISLLTKRKPFTLKEQQEYLIESLPGIGALLSKSLLQKFSSPVNILNSAESQLKETSGIGKKKAKAIRQVLDSPYT